MKKFNKFTKFVENVDRIDEYKTSNAQFITEYEQPYKPVIIQGVQREWKAQYKWTVEVFIYLILN